MDTPRPIRPCFGMRTLLSALCDGALGGLPRRYAEWHLGHCPRCTAALAALRALRARLRALVTPPPDVSAAGGLAPERWARLEAAWAEADAGRGP
jgi:anti-sigma factor RsiW